ncbi:hypothetical protein DLAC_04346 [Tieghemostelium lacteum]|uniref:Uncharacterized protein n=1 Tax=Tieghemostelium lacteum TaxID=361077 RepID=A0A151ZJI8_TIELA|nr:hypothetical protein DLAC_04346 [Tieghemostelium lacteum]|eukprot:KYQ94069.1 hypothetical protein DLAC_04346 [Tieghemostelium lacteum]
MIQNRINMILNSSSNDEDEMLISEITELKKFGNNNNNNSSSNNKNNFYEEDEEDQELLHSPKKMRSSSSSSSVVITSPITVSNIINPMNQPMCEVISTLKKLNTNQMPLSPQKPPVLSNVLLNSHSNQSTPTQQSFGFIQKSQSMGSMNQYRFERSEQEVADFDSDEEFYDDDDEDFDDDESFPIHFQSKFDEMKHSSSANGGHHSNSCHSTPTTSPKSNSGTPSKPFPTLDYKIKSESVKQNPDGTYSCPYPNCNKTIKGNKGNLSSHLRWHRRLDAEAGEARGSNPTDEGEEEFTTPSKPSQRGVQLRNQMIHYGLNLFRLDSQGKYLCFFEGCSLRMLTNFSRHIAKHERKNDKIKEDLIPLLPPHHVHGSPACSPTKRSTLSLSSPSSPTSNSSSRYATSSPFSPILSQSCSNIPMLMESPSLNSSSSQVPPTPILSSGNSNSESGRLKRKLSVNVKFNTPSIHSTQHPTTPSIHSYPYSAPCTPTTTSSNPISINNTTRSLNILSPRSLSSPSFTSLYGPDCQDFRKGKLDSIISSDNDFAVPSSSPNCSPHKKSSCSSTPNILSPLSPTTSCVPNSASSLNNTNTNRFQLPQVSLFKDIQWDYNRSQLQSSSSTLTTPKKSLILPNSPPPFQSLSPLSPTSSSSVVPFTFCSKPRSKEDEVVKSLIDLGHLY